MVALPLPRYAISFPPRLITDLFQGIAPPTKERKKEMERRKEIKLQKERKEERQEEEAAKQEENKRKEGDKGRKKVRNEE